MRSILNKKTIKYKIEFAGLAFAGFLTACGAEEQETAAPGSDASVEISPEETEEETGQGIEMSSWRESVQQMFEDPYGD